MVAFPSSYRSGGGGRARRAAEKVEQVPGRRLVAVNGFQGRAADMLVVIQPALPQIGKGDGLEAPGAGCSGFQLSIHLSRKPAASPREAIVGP